MPDITADDEMLPIPCPQCGDESFHPIGYLKMDPDLTCDACGTAFHVQGEQLRTKLETS